MTTATALVFDHWTDYFRAMHSGEKPLAWITGADGLIGRYLVAAQSPFKPRPLTRTTVDLTDFAAVEKLFQAEQPQLVVHCAAMSRSPDCQANPTLARLVNVEVTRHLAELATQTPFYFFSTDLVFDGRKGNYIETDAVNPLSVYAETKVEAELVVSRNPAHTIIRTSLNSGASKTGLTAYNEQLATQWRAGRETSLFVDEFRSPISAGVTARAIWELAERRATGLFHIAGAERLSRAEIGKLIAQRHPEIQARIKTSSIRDYQGAPRPADTSLDCAKVQALLTFPLPGLTDFLRDNPGERF